MFKEILEKVKEYKNIVIARHIGVDPDAMASQVAMRDLIKLNFPDKEVIAVGSGSNKFTYIGKLDKQVEFEGPTLLIVLDTPDKKRVDITDIDQYDFKIKMDHHPFIESFCDIEYINDNISSASEIVGYFAYNMNLELSEEIARNIFIGMVSDTNRYMFSNSKDTSFMLTSKLITDFRLDLTTIYEKMYARPMNEVRLEGFIAQNMTITENGLGYMQIKSTDLANFNADIASAGNMINNFNFINELLVWVTITEDNKNNLLKVNIRSRGPIINDIAENYNGGGHVFAAGARIYNPADVDKLIADLDQRVLEYNQKTEV